LDICLTFGSTPGKKCELQAPGGLRSHPLAPGEAKTVTLRIDPTLLSIYDESKDGWDLLPGEYKILAGPSSSETPLTAMFHIGR